MKANTGYFKRINSLFLPFKNNPDEIHEGINHYIDKIDEATERLERSYNSGDTDAFLGALANIQQMLQTVCAKRHEAYTITLSHSSKNGKTDYSNKVLQQAIADFLLLSIEMQKAQNMPASAFMPNEMETVMEATRSFAAIIQLIDAHDYAKAQDLANNLAERGYDMNEIMEALDNAKYKLAKSQALAMMNEHSERIYRTGKTSGTKIVLAVDDRPEILTTVNAALSGHYKVLGAPSGGIALEIINRQTIGLFILDIDMPVMDGFQLAMQIRTMRDYKNTPILFLTANSSRERIQKAIKHGINDFVVKPAYSEMLLSKVKKHLE
jgi:CheY-like chemotaxis protein